MNFSSMKYFTVLASEKSFTRAAEMLHITQQSLSSHIAGLEEDYSLQYSRTFAVRLRQARKEARLTQAQLAAQIGMTQGGYTQYENAGREPSLSTLAKLSRILKRPTDWLLGLA